jgi:hypothetical protein
MTHAALQVVIRLGSSSDSLSSPFFPLQGLAGSGGQILVLYMQSPHALKKKASSEIEQKKSNKNEGNE